MKICEFITCYSFVLTGANVFALINSLIRRYLCGITQQTKRSHCARSPLEAKQLVYPGKTTRPTRQTFYRPTRQTIQSPNETNIQLPNEANHSIAQRDKPFNRPTRQTIQSPNEANHSIAQRGKNTHTH